MAMKYFLWMDFYTPYYEKCVIFIHMYVRVRGDEYEKIKIIQIHSSEGKQKWARENCHKRDK